MKVKSLSRVRLFATPWTVAYQALPSIRFSRQEYWSGLPFHSPGDLPDPGIEPRSPALQADTLPPEPRGKPEYQVVNLMIKFGEFMTAKQAHGTAPLPSKLLQQSLDRADKTEHNVRQCLCSCVFPFISSSES